MSAWPCPLAIFLVTAASASAGGPMVDPPLTFEAVVRPILKAHCFQCHGEQGRTEAGLDLRLRRSLVAGGDSGPAIVPGEPGESRLLERVREGEMPPGKEVKKLSRDQVGLIERWVAAGARTAGPEPEKIESGAFFTDDERRNWSFQPIRRAPVPRVQDADRARTPVDAFLLSKLEEHSATFAGDASRQSLLSRGFLDLVGLPPSPSETDGCRDEEAPDGYERLLDRLLASPQYGERWGRHWLDVAGYADSDGYAARDNIREHAFRYRDYVIGSFNADKGFDQLVWEQLAGDEMVASSSSKDLAPDQIDKLSATGFLLMAPNGITGGGADPLVAYDDFTAEAVKIVSSAFLGLSVGCARCHDHRYEPISQEDYYRLRAVFEPGFAALRQRSPRDRLISLFTDADRQAVRQIEAEAKKLDDMQQELIKPFFEAELAKLPQEVRPSVREAYATPSAQRSQHQRRLVNKFPRLNIDVANLARVDRQAAEEFQRIGEQAAQVRARMPKEGFVQALAELPGHAPPTFLLHRGDPRQPRQAMVPADLSILHGDSQSARFPLDDPTLPTTGRRLAFAQRLADGSHPLLARVLVNRVWLHHFGRGICGAKADFGMTGEKPSHPELLDWLARDFMDHGWSLKRLHRLIMTSTAYRQSLRRSARLAQIDPENRLQGGWTRHRLEAEIIRDAILAVSGRLNSKAGGPPVPVMPDPAGEIVIGRENSNAGIPGPVIPMLGEEFRRSIYLQVRRSMPLTFLQTFDAPAMEPNCEARTASTVAPQSLLLMNNRFVVEQSRFFAERVRGEAGRERKAQVTHAWKLALGRTPEPDELEDAVALLEELTEQFRDLATAPAALPQGTAARDNASGNTTNGGSEGSPTVSAADPEQAALAVLCQTLWSSNEFLYVD